MSRTREKLEVWVIVNAEGHYMTGNLVGGETEFSPNEDDALQLDIEERDFELKQPYMPKDAVGKLLMTV